MILEMAWFNDLLYGSSGDGSSVKPEQLAALKRTKAAKVVRFVRLMRVIRIAKLFERFYNEEGDKKTKKEDSKVASHLSEQTTRKVVIMVLLLWQMLRGIKPSTTKSPQWQSALGCFAIGLHMGYAQVGTGLVATLVLAKAYDRDLLAVNSAKCIVVIVTAIVSTTSLAIDGAIAWGPAIALALGCALGSYLASHWSVKQGANAVRRVVLVIATLTLLEQLRQIWLLLC